jgi:DNA polymerase V
MTTKAEIVYKPDLSKSLEQPNFDAQVHAGFPSPASDYLEGKLDLNKYLIKNPASTFFVRVSGDSMIGAGIHHGDLLIVDRSPEPKNKNIVIAVLNGELTVKRIKFNNGKITLEPENKDFPVQEISNDMQFEVWGIVTNVIHKL